MDKPGIKRTKFEIILTKDWDKQYIYFNEEWNIKEEENE